MTNAAQWTQVLGRFSKRLFDLILTVSALFTISPVLIMIAILIRFRIGSPVIFLQDRSGLQGHPFTLYKFRTMTDERDDDGKLLADEFRLTNFGRFMRSTSLDELPGLWNVLTGKMSLVGPRPLPTRYLSRFTTEQLQRLNVQPGITGYAQIQGRNSLDWEEKFAWDIKYIKERTFWLDVRILLLTIVRVLRRDGIDSPDCVSSPEFIGSQAKKVA